MTEISLDALEAALVHGVHELFAHLRNGSAQPDQNAPTRTAAGDASATALLAAASSPTWTAVVRHIALAEPEESVPVRRIASAIGSTPRGVLAGIGRAAAHGFGGYKNLPLLWEGSGDDQEVSVDAATRAGLRDALGLDDEVAQALSAAVDQAAK